MHHIKYGVQTTQTFMTRMLGYNISRCYIFIFFYQICKSPLERNLTAIENYVGFWLCSYGGCFFFVFFLVISQIYLAVFFFRHSFIHVLLAISEIISEHMLMKQ